MVLRKWEELRMTSDLKSFLSFEASEGGHADPVTSEEVVSLQACLLQYLWVDSKHSSALRQNS